MDGVTFDFKDRCVHSNNNKNKISKKKYIKRNKLIYNSPTDKQTKHKQANT